MTAPDATSVNAPPPPADDRDRAPALGFRGRPSERDIAAIIAALALVRPARLAAPRRPVRAVSADDPWGTPELIIRRRVAATSTLPHVTAATPTTGNLGGTAR